IGVPVEGPLDYTHSARLTTRRIRVRASPVALVWLLLLVGILPPRLGAQSAGPRPAIVVVNLRFDGEHANVLGPGDTAVVAGAASKLLGALRGSGLGRPGDSGPG